MKRHEIRGSTRLFSPQLDFWLIAALIGEA